MSSDGNNPLCFNLPALIADLLLLMQAPAQRQHRVLRYSFSPLLAEFFLSGPEEILRQELVHLLGHAIHQSETSAIHLHVEAGTGDRVCFCVRFQQALAADPARNCLCQTLVVCPFSGLDKKKQHHSEDMPRLAGLAHGKHLLIADDNPFNSQVPALLLRKAGARVDLAVNGLEVMALALAQEYDLILMDIRMPEMDGLETARALRELSGKPCATVTIVGMSADFFDNDQQLYLDAGLNDILVKPMDIAQLCRALAHCPAAPVTTHHVPALLDWKRLLLLREQLDRDTYLDFLRDGASAAIENVEELAEQASDFPRLACTAHRLAGLAAALGAERLLAASRDLQQCAKQSDAQAVSKQLAGIRADCAETLALLRQLMR